MIFLPVAFRRRCFRVRRMVRHAAGGHRRLSPASSVSRYSLAMISALMVLRRLPSHIAIAWSQAFS